MLVYVLGGWSAQRVTDFVRRCSEPQGFHLVGEGWCRPTTGYVVPVVAIIVGVGCGCAWCVRPSFGSAFATLLCVYGRLTRYTAAGAFLSKEQCAQVQLL
jgi:hypothetical protein